VRNLDGAGRFVFAGGQSRSGGRDVKLGMRVRKEKKRDKGIKARIFDGLVVQGFVL